jgi:hypothetical protein
MPEDRYIASIDRVERAAAHLHDALDVTVGALREARTERLAGVGLVDIVQGLVERRGKHLRLAPTAALREFERTVTSYRAATVRALVDDEHMTFSDVGHMTGVSRQMIARLYHSDPGADAVVEDEGSSPAPPPADA